MTEAQLCRTADGKTEEMPRTQLSKDYIHLTITQIKPRTRRMLAGLQWVDEDGKVIREIPPTPPCKKYFVIHPDIKCCHGVDVEEMLKEALKYEQP